MTQAEDDPAYSLAAELAELVVDERLAGDIEQALGDLSGQGPAGLPARRPGLRRVSRLMSDDDLRPFEIESEPDLLQPCLAS